MVADDMVLVFGGWICARRSGLVYDVDGRGVFGTAINLKVDEVASDAGRIL